MLWPFDRFYCPLRPVVLYRRSLQDAARDSIFLAFLYKIFPVFRERGSRCSALAVNQGRDHSTYSLDLLQLDVYLAIDHSGAAQWKKKYFAILAQMSQELLHRFDVRWPLNQEHFRKP